MIAQSWLVSWISDDVNFLDDEFKKKPPFYLPFIFIVVALLQYRKFSMSQTRHLTKTYISLKEPTETFLSIQLLSPEKWSAVNI